jgi:hypothetical protein
VKTKPPRCTYADYHKSPRIRDSAPDTPRSVDGVPVAGRGRRPRTAERGREETRPERVSVSLPELDRSRSAAGGSALAP